MGEARVLPADVFDALELSALVFGGIGGGAAWDSGDWTVPFCVVGHANFAELSREAEIALRDAFRGRPTDHNDTAVLHVNKRRHGNASHARISFADWCKELNVIRGSTGEPTRTPNTEQENV